MFPDIGKYAVIKNWHNINTLIRADKSEFQKLKQLAVTRNYTNMQIKQVDESVGCDIGKK